MDDKDPVCFHYRVRFNSVRMNDPKGSFTLCDVRLRFFNRMEGVVWMLIILFTWCDSDAFLCVMCDITFEWVPDPFCNCDCDSKKSHIVPCEWALDRTFYRHNEVSMVM